KNIGPASAGAIALDGSGNIYITGAFRGTVDFDPGTGVFNLAADSSYAAFILKLDTFGNFIWAKSIGGAVSLSSAGGSAIVINTSGELCIAGAYWGIIDFDPGAGITNLIATGNMFILKLDSSGNFIWAKGIGGGSGNYFITADVSGNIYTTGSFSGTIDFDPGAGADSLSSIIPYDCMFILKLDAAGNFVWAKNMVAADSTDYSEGTAILVDAAYNVYTIGRFNGTVDFDPGPGVVNLTNGGDDAFISKLDASGNLVWVKKIDIAVSSAIYVSSLIADATGNLYITGSFAGTIDFDPGAGVMSITRPGTNAFILKTNSSANLISVESMGGSSATQVEGISIALDGADNIYTVGSYQGTADFDCGSGTFYLTASHPAIYVHKLDQSNVTLGANNFVDNNAVTIYPNPSNGLFNIALASSKKNTTIEIYNSIGELVYNRQNVSAETLINLNDNATGLYFVKVISENKIIGTKKIMKE
ncbi:MAG: T9SS type A sorting domain-containing protein, partial [Bacteroidia bacterium]